MEKKTTLSDGHNAEEMHATKEDGSNDGDEKAQAGVRKVEAAASVWSKAHLIGAYVMSVPCSPSPSSSHKHEYLQPRPRRTSEHAERRVANT
jgi:hypothetical protein